MGLELKPLFSWQLVACGPEICSALGLLFHYLSGAATAGVPWTNIPSIFCARVQYLYIFVENARNQLGSNNGRLMLALSTSVEPEFNRLKQDAPCDDCLPRTAQGLCHLSLCGRSIDMVVLT